MRKENERERKSRGGKKRRGNERETLLETTWHLSERLECLHGIKLILFMYNNITSFYCIITI